jgi:uncharacterized membrane protein
MYLAFLFPWLLLLHVLGAIVAFGPTYAYAIIGAMGGKEPQHANFGLRASLAISHRIVIPVALSMPITGAGMILVRDIPLMDRAFWWLSIAIVLYTVTVAFALLVQTKNVERVVALTSAPPPPGAGGPPPEVMGLVKRIQQGGKFTGAMIALIVALMVLKPAF